MIIDTDKFRELNRTVPFVAQEGRDSCARVIDTIEQLYAMAMQLNGTPLPDQKATPDGPLSTDSIDRFIGRYNS